ncbi:hypothetical protein EVAR_98513_1 [Eumeta japonica]|uniref:Uncharacterized protein n=1 Tax=Eumeta variegata TaxID=151549 RepID=A0A4C2A898_EUMVA|nr:hypothetical protein EVAR_98513_1 [Eumeta japonica]
MKKNSNFIHPKYFSLALIDVFFHILWMVKIDRQGVHWPRHFTPSRTVGADGAVRRGLARTRARTRVTRVAGEGHSISARSNEDERLSIERKLL